MLPYVNLSARADHELDLHQLYIIYLNVNTHCLLTQFINHYRERFDQVYYITACVEYNERNTRDYTLKLVCNAKYKQQAVMC